MERTDQPDHQHTPHIARDCQLCGTLRHPAQAAQGRALQRHLAARSLPIQRTGAGR